MSSREQPLTHTPAHTYPMEQMMAQFQQQMEVREQRREAQLELREQRREAQYRKARGRFVCQRSPNDRPPPTLRNSFVLSRMNIKEISLGVYPEAVNEVPRRKDLSTLKGALPPLPSPQTRPS